LLRRVFGINDIIFLHFDKSTVIMPWDEFIDHLVNEFQRNLYGHQVRVEFYKRLRPEIEFINVDKLKA